MTGSRGSFNVQSMIRRILLILLVLAVPAGLASASQALADNADPAMGHQPPVMVKLSPAPQPATTTREKGEQEDAD
ncbi:hypothetical protein [Glutamicibacter mishrai]|uniref:Uncharacterized protein n=2 Tax=Glutamicibacter mishrai TaxID=1775880 RepID=A0A6H0SN88_9MICC|nr:hypothetical protein D3791_12740 [Glutamicibacter mishrai]